MPSRSASSWPKCALQAQSPSRRRAVPGKQNFKSWDSMSKQGKPIRGLPRTPSRTSPAQVW
eukprot:8201591-Lingulodinium_polyedra.AAC.1